MLSIGEHYVHLVTSVRQPTNQPTNMKRQLYIVKQNPRDRAWYVLGECLGYWMPVSGAMKSKSAAERWAEGQHKADSNANHEVNGALSASNQIQ